MSEADAQARNRRIVDPHLHLWDIRAGTAGGQEAQRFLLDEAVAATAASGRRITHTVYVEAHAMYRRDGPTALRSLGETGFANGMAAMSASGAYGNTLIAHRIVGNVDLTAGSEVHAVLDRHREVAGERFRGVRMNTAWHPDGLFGAACVPGTREVLGSAAFAAGAAVLSACDLSLDVWCLPAQIHEVAALADTVPGLSIVLDHAGTPFAPGVTWAEWAAAIGRLAERSNVAIKIGGMGMNLATPIPAFDGTATATELASAWRPAIEHCVEAFTPARCMFESNYPPDRAAGSYRTIFDAFESVAEQYTADEADSLFRRTASDFYRIEEVPR